MSAIDNISMDHLDSLLSEAANSDDYASWHSALQNIRLVPDEECSADPFSADYAAFQMRLYQRISGRKSYSFAAEAAVGMDQYDGVTASHPYLTQDLPTIGSYMMGVGHILKVLGKSKISSVLEYGPGWGHTTVALARSGIKAYVYDLEPNFIRMIQEQARLFGVTIEANVGLFGDLPDNKVDAILFFECFHHCFNHDEIIGKIKKSLLPNGRILLAGEPVTFGETSYPWGVRLDGHSLWAIRTHGWMELGFQEGYLIELFRRHGFSLNKHECPQAGEVGTIYEFVMI